MKRTVWIALAVVGAAVLARIMMAAFGTTPIVRVAGEVGIALSLVTVGAALILGAPAAFHGKSLYASALLLVLLGAGVVYPLIKLAHPTAPLFEGNLGGAKRTIEAAPAPRDGVYRLEVGAERLTDHPATSDEAYRVVVHARSSGETAAEGQKRNEKPDVFDVELKSGERASVSLERGGGWVGVWLGREQLGWSLVRILAVLAALIGVLVDIATTSGRGRGLVALTVVASAAYVFQLDPATKPAAGQVIAAAAVAIVLGALIAALVALPLGKLLRQRRS